MSPELAQQFNYRDLLRRADEKRVAGEFETAETLYRAVLRSVPHSAAAWNNLGLVCQAQEELDDALECFRHALELRPDAAGIFANIGNILRESNSTDEELAAYEHAISLDPKDPDLHCSYAVALLRKGDFARGWHEYEWRARSREANSELGIRTFPRPLWDGSPFFGKRLMVYAEQGLGDTVQFARFLPSLKRLGGHVIFACQPELMSACSRIDGVTKVVDFSAPTLPGFDMYTGLMSLPYLLGSNAIPPFTRYLEATPESIRRWNAELGSGKRKVGLVWVSNTENRIGRLKSVPFKDLLPLGSLHGIEWISLQIGDGVHEYRGFRDQFSLRTVDRDLATMDETIGVIECLDLVVTVDTVIAHVAGAMGKTVWTLLPYAADWRWMTSSESTLWYPTMRLYRQSERGVWNTVVQSIAHDLETQAAD